MKSLDCTSPQMFNSDALLADGFDDAVIGRGSQYPMAPVIIYDYDKCIEILMKDNEWDYEAAVDWMEYNVVSAYMGVGTPIFMKRACNEKV